MSKSRENINNFILEKYVSNFILNNSIAYTVTFTCILFSYNFFIQQEIYEIFMNISLGLYAIYYARIYFTEYLPEYHREMYENDLPIIGRGDLYNELSPHISKEQRLCELKANRELRNDSSFLDWIGVNERKKEKIVESDINWSPWSQIDPFDIDN